MNSENFGSRYYDLDHVLTGRINSRGYGSGYHYEHAANGSSRIAPSSIVREAHGTYSAFVEIWDPARNVWVQKKSHNGIPLRSTFFPLDWSEARILYEVTEAFKAASVNPYGKWTGTTPGGLEVSGYAKSGRIAFFPTGR